MRTDRLSYAATAVRRLNARATLDGRHGTWFERRNVNGVTTVFGVLAVRVDGRCRATHYKVQLPIRPNGATGWVSAGDVRVRKVNIRIAIDLSQRRITLFRDGRIVLLTTAAIGAPSTPTPTGRFYVNQRLLAADPIGGYGPGAIGISAFSPVLRNWPQGGPDRDPRHGCPRDDRFRKFARMPACSQFRRLAPPAPRGRGDAGRDQGVIPQARVGARLPGPTGITGCWRSFVRVES